MATDYVLLQVCQGIALCHNRCLVQYLGGLLERCCRHKARRLQCRAGDTLQDLARRCGNDITYLNSLQILTFEYRVQVAQTTNRDDLTRLYLVAVASIGYNNLVVELVVDLHKLPLIDNLVLEEAGVARIINLNLVHHLANDNLEVLVVDLHTLHTIYVLNLVHDILLNLRRTEDTQNVARGDRAVRQCHTSLHVVVLLNQDLTRQGYQILTYLTVLRRYNDLAVTALDLTECDLAIDLRYDCGVRRVTSLEQLGNTRQTTGDIACLTNNTRNLDQNIACLDLGILLNNDVCRNGQVVLFLLNTALINDLDDRVLVLVLRLDNNLLAQTCLLVRLIAVGYTLDNVLEGNLTLELRDDNSVVGIPLADQIALLNLGTVLHKQRCTIGQSVSVECNIGCGIDNAELRLAADNHIDLLALIVLGLNRTQLVDLQTTLVLRDDVGLDRSTACNTTDVERTQCQLSTGLTDRLCSDDADNLTLLNHTRRCQVATVALRADTVASLASQHRTDLDLFQRRLLDCLGDRLGDLLTCCAEQLTGDGVIYIVQSHATQDALIERLNHVLILLDCGCNQTTQRTAILLIDDHVLSNIYQSTSQVTCVCGLQRRIRQTLTSTVGRNEVLQHRQTLLKVRQNRVLDDLTAFGTTLLGLSHQTTHTAQLTNLLLRTTSTRIQHHINGVETVHILGQGLGYGLGQLVIDLSPNVDNLIVSLVVGDKTHIVALGDVVGHLVALLHQRSLLLGDNHCVEVKRQTALECHTVTHCLDVVQEVSHLIGTCLLHHHCNDIAQRTLGQQLVDIANLLRHNLVEHNSTDGGLLQIADRVALSVDIINYATNLCVQLGTTLVVGDDSLLRTVEHQTFALSTGFGLGDIVQTEDHILRRYGNRRTVSRVQDVVRTQHQHLSLQDCCIAQRQMDCHLVAVEVRIERRTRQRVQLHCLTLDQLGLECLNTQTVKGRSTVHQYGMTLDNVLQDVPDYGILSINDLLS